MNLKNLISINAIEIHPSNGENKLLIKNEE